MKLSRLSRKLRRGFTLVEVMIAVLIIGILLTIATPNMIRARETARAKSCQANLKTIEGAKQMWALETNRAPGAVPSWGQLVGEDLYIKKQPECQGGGTYLLRTVALPASCSRGANVAGTTADDHILP